MALKTPVQTDSASRRYRLFVAMCLAASVGSVSLVREICRADVDIQQLRTPGGRTPLHIACANDRHVIGDILLTFGYSPLAVDRFGDTPISLAIRFDARQSMTLIQRRQTTPDERDRKQIRRGDATALVDEPELRRVDDAVSGSVVTCDILSGSESSRRCTGTDALRPEAEAERQADDVTVRNSRPTEDSRCSGGDETIDTKTRPNLSGQSVDCSVLDHARVDRNLGCTRAKSEIWRAIGRKKKQPETDGIKTPTPRPELSTIRYRPWKTWLNELYSTRLQQQLTENTDADRILRRKRNEEAFRRWKLQVASRAWNDADDDSSEGSSTSGGSEVDRTRDVELAYRKWLEKKGPATRAKRGAEIRTSSGIFVVGCTEGPLPRIDARTVANSYIGCYSDWLRRNRTSLLHDRRRDEDARNRRDDRRRHVTSCRSSNDDARTGSFRRSRLQTLSDVDRLRVELILDGITYDEWLWLKHRSAAA